MTYEEWMKLVPTEITGDVLWKMNAYRQARFYEYALGSARETRDWYYKGRHILGEEVSLHRLRLITEIIRQLLTIIPDMRGKSIHEEGPAYQSYSIDQLLTSVPLPED
jgi:hypothetical protein